MFDKIIFIKFNRKERTLPLLLFNHQIITDKIQNIIQLGLGRHLKIY